MKKLFTFVTMALMAIGVQAQSETALFSADGTYGNGATLSTENCKVVLGNDRTTKNYDLKLATCKDYCAALFGQTVQVKNEETDEMEDKTRIVYVVGNQNPKDGELNGDASSGTGYNPAKCNLPQSGTYYMITPSKDGHICAYIVLNNGKSLYVAKASDGTCFAPSDLVVKADGEEATEVPLSETWQVENKTSGTLEFDVVANETYYVFCGGSKLSFGGYVFTPEEGQGGEAGVVTFEDFEVNADGYQNEFEDGCFEAGGFTFNTNYFPEWSYWSGFAISNRTETSFVSLTPDQFNSCVGHGVDGSAKYAVVYPQGEKIEADAPEGEEVSGFYITNSAWVVDAILHTDGMTEGPFTKGDYFLLKITGTHADESTATVEFYLADYRSDNEADHYYVNDWRWVDLSSLGKVTELSFLLESSRNNSFGMTTPGYFCLDNFNGTAPSNDKVATFEEITLSPESSYCGAGVEGETVTDSYGSQVTKSQYTSGAYRFTTFYNPQWASWTGFAVSNETSTNYTNYTDQFRSCVGHGYDGSSNYCVVYLGGNQEAVEPVSGAEEVSGMYITNSAWNVAAYTEGDGMTPGAFTTGDWCKLTITGVHADDTSASVEVYLADYRSDNEADHYYINQWQWVDLTPLGEVKSITFAITSSRNNEWGITTPTYFCMDNFGGTPDESANIHHNSTTTNKTAAIYTLDGKRLTAPQRGINIIRMSDGTTRKVIMR